MTEWRAFHVHYADVDRLILECVQPFFERHEEDLRLRSWERHYAGGSHLRIRLCADAGRLRAAGTALEEQARAFLACHPSADATDYSEERAATLLEQEGTPAASRDELVYRNNAVFEVPYPPAHDVYVSREAADLMECFRHDALPLATHMIASPRPRSEAILRCYFLQALEVIGDLAEGSVSWKSHWEGFASSFPSLAVIERITSTYERHRDHVRGVLQEVLELRRAGRLHQDPELGEWSRLLYRYGRRVESAIRAGVKLTEQPADREQASRLQRRAAGATLRPSRFVETFLGDDRFLASLQYEPAFLVPRVLTNLLYTLAAAAGLKPIDKFALCHFAFRAVEDHTGRDLDDILGETVARVLASHQGRWTAVEQG